MSNNTIWPQKVAMLLILIMLPALLLLYTGFTLPTQMSLLQQELHKRSKYRELLAEIYNLNTSVQEYILFGDSQALNNFHYYSSEVIKREMEIYATEKHSLKQDVAELIVFSKDYISFVDHELLPVIKIEGNGANDSREVILWSFRDYSHQLVNRANSLAESGRQENKASLELITALLDNKGSLMLFLALLSIGSSIYGAALLWPWLIRHISLGYVAKDTQNAVIIIERKERILYLNPVAESIFAMNLESVSGKSLGELLNQYPHMQNVVQPLQDTLSKNEKVSDYTFNYSADGQKLLLAVDCNPVHLLKMPAGAVLTARKTTKAKDGNILLETIEIERKHLSIEIHDWIGRYMSSIIHSLDYILRINGKTLPEEIKENLILLRSQCQNAAIDMRSIMHDIHPYLIEKVGLIPALESYGSNFERLHNIKVYIFYSQRSLPLEREKEILVYRIIQEALTNVARHSKATEVDIHFAETNDTIKIQVIDNGGAKDNTLSPGKGLWGIKERAGLLGGHIAYGFQDGGFSITLTLPLNEEDKPGYTGEGDESIGENRDYAG